MSQEDIEIRELEVSRCVTLSTHHITKEENADLQRDDAPLVCYCIRYGHLICLPIDDEGMMEELIETELPEYDASEGLTECVKLAYRLGCRYLRFDCDYPPHMQLPVYDW